MLLAALRRSCSLYHTTTLGHAHSVPNTHTSLHQISGNTYLVLGRSISWTAATEREIFASKEMLKAPTTAL